EGCSFRSSSRLGPHRQPSARSWRAQRSWEFLARISDSSTRSSSTTTPDVLIGSGLYNDVDLAWGLLYPVLAGHLATTRFSRPGPGPMGARRSACRLAQTAASSDQRRIRLASRSLRR